MLCSDKAGAPARERFIGPEDIVASGLCIGCGACAAYSGSAMRLDRFGQYKPQNSGGTTDREAFSRLCPFSPLAPNEDVLAGERFAMAPLADDRIGRFEAAYVGHAVEGSFRLEGSSGGMANWVAVELLHRGLVDGIVHAAPLPGPESDHGYFKYRVSRSEREIRDCAKSRYHPLELSEVIGEMRARSGRYAVIGIPCFVKAVHLICRVDPLLQQRVRFTLGLFCGHMKSTRFVESFAWQMQVSPEAVTGVDYRAKQANRPANWYVAQLTLADGRARSRHWWDMVDGDWGAGFFQNSACDFCDDVVAETADISFGDAWLEPYLSDGRGTNVVIVRSPHLHQLLREGIAEHRLQLSQVDADFVARTQAAGLRHRREGLAYRLGRFRGRVKPRKRVEALQSDLTARRRTIYAWRLRTSRWSHRIFWFARAVRLPAIYLGWARASKAIYHGFAYSRGKVGRALTLIGWGSADDDA